MLTLSGRSARISSDVIRPAFVCGSSPSSSAISHARPTYSIVVRTPRVASALRYSLNATSGLSPRHISASLHPSSAPRPLRDLVRHHRPCAGIAGILAERAVAASIAAEIRDRQENLARVSDVAA